MLASAAFLASVPSLARAMLPSSSSPSPDRARPLKRLETIERLLPRLFGDGEATERLLFERRSLLRQLHGIPQGIELPLSVCSADLPPLS